MEWMGCTVRISHSSLGTRSLSVSAPLQHDLCVYHVQPGYPARGGQPVGKVQSEDEFEVLYDQFPEDFVWATATSSYQIEGGWNADGESCRTE